MKKEIQTLSSIAILAALQACTPATPVALSIPSVEYVQKLKGQQPFASPQNARNADAPTVRNATLTKGDAAPSVFLVDGEGEAALPGGGTTQGDVVTNEQPATDNGVKEEHFDTTRASLRDYSGPLDLGDPGVTASLWKESRGGNELFRDDRAFQPMDLITITVSEKDTGTREANTDTKSETTLSAALKNFFGLEVFGEDANPSIDPSALINATSSNEFKGKGKTDRKGTLTAKISAMVAEVLPSGIIRIEGKKIVAVNGEEQVMVISGLVRPRDVTSDNEVDSSKIANMRIDYYGRGVVDEAQSPGWGSRIIRTVWPF